MLNLYHTTKTRFCVFQFDFKITQNELLERKLTSISAIYDVFDKIFIASRMFPA
jgi:hypothetical protein